MFIYHYIILTVAFLYYAFILNCDALSQNKKQKVCVIGAGAAGLVSAKHLAENPNEFHIVVFEKNSNVGGLWIYNDRTDVDEHGLPLRSPMYKYLRTNGFKEFMAFPDYRHWNGNRSFVRHEEVLSYLSNFTDHFNLRQYVKFNTLVEKVTKLSNDGAWGSTKYTIKIKNLNTWKTSKVLCDAVIVANGWNSEPNIPKIPGLENFSGKILHSVSYRMPEEYAGKTVVILGASFSGIDIGLQISDYAKKIYLSHRHDKIESSFPSNIEQVAGVVEAGGDTLILQDGSKITADVFMFCTGYRFSAPFLDETNGVTVNKKYIYPVYKHIINAKHPSMAFIGLPQRILPFLSYHFEVKYFIETLRGNVVLPDKETMIKESEVIDKDHPYTAVENGQFNYFHELETTNAKPLPNYYISSAAKWHQIMINNLTTFREYNIIILNENEVKLIHSSQGPAQDLDL